MNVSPLTNLVLEKIRSLPSTEAAAEFFGASVPQVEDWVKGYFPVPLSAVEKVFDPSLKPPPRPKKVCIALPWYKSTHPLTSISVTSLFDKATMRVMMNFDDAFIAHSRNKLAENFLRSDSEWMLTVDDDMILPNGDAKWFNTVTGFNLPEEFAGRNAITHLISRGKTLIGGLYFGRRPGGRALFCGTLSKHAPLSDTVVRTRWVATGCLLIHRSVYTDIEKTFPSLARDADGNNGNWFTSTEHERTGSKLDTGEDVIFCERAKLAGHQPYIDFGLRCGHIGSAVY